MWLPSWDSCWLNLPAFPSDHLALKRLKSKQQASERGKQCFRVWPPGRSCKTEKDWNLLNARRKESEKVACWISNWVLQQSIVCRYSTTAYSIFSYNVCAVMCYLLCYYFVNYISYNIHIHFVDWIQPQCLVSGLCFSLLNPCRQAEHVVANSFSPRQAQLPTHKDPRWKSPKVFFKDERSSVSGVTATGLGCRHQGMEVAT